MDRGKVGVGRGGKSKIAQHPPDLFALGTKNSRSESSESKRPGVIHGKPTSSLSSVSSEYIFFTVLNIPRIFLLINNKVSQNTLTSNKIFRQIKKKFEYSFIKIFDFVMNSISRKKNVFSAC